LIYFLKAYLERICFDKVGKVSEHNLPRNERKKRIGNEGINSYLTYLERINKVGKVSEKNRE
jgi:hypothetical protein